MKYLLALQEKNLTVEQLSNKTKKDIEDLNLFNEQVEEIKKNAGENPSQELLDDIKKMESKISILDDKIYSYILKFDLEKYNERKKMMHDMVEKRKQKAAEKVNKTKEPTQATTLKPTHSEQPVSQASSTVTTQNTADSVDLSGEVKASEANTASQSAVVVDLYENKTNHEENANENNGELYTQEEFRPVEKVTKKSNGVYFACIGIGALLLTFGTVNIFKQKV